MNVLTAATQFASHLQQEPVVLLFLEPADMTDDTSTFRDTKCASADRGQVAQRRAPS